MVGVLGALVFSCKKNQCQKESSKGCEQVVFCVIVEQLLNR